MWQVTWLGWQALVCGMKARPVALGGPQAVDTTPPASPEDTLLSPLWMDRGPALLWPPSLPTVSTWGSGDTVRAGSLRLLCVSPCSL